MFVRVDDYLEPRPVPTQVELLSEILPSEGKLLPLLRGIRLGQKQGDPIGRNFAIWANFFSRKNRPMGKILAMKKSPKIDLNKAKKNSKRGFLQVFQKYSKIFISFFM